MAIHPRQSGAVAVGDPVPEVTLPDQDGTPVPLSSFRGRWLVVYFYPADDSPGCTKESCAFRDAYEDFTDLGAEVVGISGDSADSHRAFAERHRLPFTLLADTEGEAKKAFGVKASLGLLPGRTTYVIDPDGVVRKVFSSQLQFSRHHREALEAIRSA